MKIVKLLSVLIVMLVIGNVTLTNRSVDDSLYVAELTKNIQTLNSNNLIRETRIAELGSLPQLTAKIEAAGFVATPQIVALPTPSSVALR